jgi:heme/copper-type cytochrome/quinol oxidase subunit 2
MRSYRDYRSNWSGGEKTPGLSPASWNALAIPAAVLFVMAILQVIGFGKFKDFLDNIKVGWPAVVAVVIIIAEVWGAISLLRVPMSAMLRFIGVSMAVAVVSFWFVETLFLVTSDTARALQNNGLFGKYLSQTPGWWTVIEVSILMFWVVYAAELLKWRPARS